MKSPPAPSTLAALWGSFRLASDMGRGFLRRGVSSPAPPLITRALPLHAKVGAHHDRHPSWILRSIKHVPRTSDNDPLLTIRLKLSLWVVLAAQGIVLLGVASLCPLACRFVASRWKRRGRGLRLLRLKISSSYVLS